MLAAAIRRLAAAAADAYSAVAPLVGLPLTPPAPPPPPPVPEWATRVLPAALSRWLYVPGSDPPFVELVVSFIVLLYLFETALEFRQRRCALRVGPGMPPSPPPKSEPGIRVWRNGDSIGPVSLPRA